MPKDYPPPEEVLSYIEACFEKLTLVFDATKNLIKGANISHPAPLPKALLELSERSLESVDVAELGKLILWACRQWLDLSGDLPDEHRGEFTIEDLLGEDEE